MQLYETLADGILKDQIVIGIKDNYVRDRLLRTSQEGDDLMLNKAIDICRAAEQTVTHSRTYRILPSIVPPFWGVKKVGNRGWDFNRIQQVVTK